MRKTLSPYYITIPLVSPSTSIVCSSYTLNIRVWDGLESSVPFLASYSKTVKNSSNSTGSHKVNISRLINDFIDLAPQDNISTGIINGNNQRWVQSSVVYIDKDGLLEDEQSELIELVVKGYAYGDQGENTSTPLNKVLLSGTEFNVNREGIFILPIETEALTITAISYPDNQINFSQALALTTDSSEMVKYLYINVSDATTDTYIELVYNGVTTTLNVLDECKYDPIDIVFF